MEVCADHKFKPVLQILQDFGWSFTTNLANAQEHVPEAECNNHILKEHIHTTYHGIPYKMIQRTFTCYMVMETTAKLNYFPAKGGCPNCFSSREILHPVKLDYKKHCSMPLLSYVLTHNEPTLTNTVHVHSLDCLFLCAIQTRQGGYDCYHIPTNQIITQPYITVIPATSRIIVTINALSKSDGIHNLQITDLCGQLLFDSMDPGLLAAVDGDDDEDTSHAGVQGNNTSLVGVPIPTTTVMPHKDNDSDGESDHNSIDPNESDENSSNASVHSTGSHVPVHSTTSEPPQHPPYEEEPDDIELPELETQVPILCQSEKVLVPPSDYIPQMGGKTYTMNIQTETSQDEDKGLVHNHDEARVLATVITTFNEHMECIVEEYGRQHVVTYSLKAGINKFGD